MHILRQTDRWVARSPMTPDHGWPHDPANGQCVWSVPSILCRGGPQYSALRLRTKPATESAPAHRAGHLPRKRVADFLRRGCDSNINIIDDWNPRRADFNMG